MTTTRLLRGAREGALWFGALAGLLAVVAGVAVVALNASFLVFRSGSMSPEIDTGSLAFARPLDAPEIRSGDVVTVRSSDGAQITHRVVSSTVRGDEASLVLQGDANSTPDAELYVVQTVQRVDFSVPYAGYVVAYAMTPPGLVAIAAISIALFLVSSDDGPTGSRTAPDRRHRRGRRSGRAAVTATAVAATVVATAVTGTQAAFNDTATMTTGAFSAATVTPPTGVACVNAAGNNDYIGWTAPSGYTPTAYRVYLNGSATPTATVTPPTTQWAPADTFFPTGYTVRVAAVRGSWVSAQAGPASISTVFLFQGSTCA